MESASKLSLTHNEVSNSYLFGEDPVCRFGKNSDIDIGNRVHEVENCSQPIKKGMIYSKEQVFGHNITPRNLTTPYEVDLGSRTPLKFECKLLAPGHFPFETSNRRKELIQASEIVKELEALRIKQRIRIQSISQMTIGKELKLVAEVGNGGTSMREMCNGDCPSLDQVCQLTVKTQDLEENLLNVSELLKQYYDFSSANFSRLNAGMLKGKGADEIRYKTCAKVQSREAGQYINVKRSLLQHLEKSLNEVMNQRQNAVDLNEELKMQLMSLKTEQDHLRNGDANAKAAFNRINRKLQTMMSQLSEENACLKETVEKANLDKNKHRRRDNCTSCKQLEEFEEELGMTNPEMLQRNDSEEFKGIDRKLKMVEIRIDIVRKEKEKAIADVSKMCKKITKLEEENAVVKGLKLTIRELEDRCHRLQAERTELKDEKKAVCERIENHSNIVKKLQTECDAFKMRFEDKRIQGEFLKKKNNELKIGLCKARECCKELTAKLTASEELNAKGEERYQALQPNLEDEVMSNLSKGISGGNETQLKDDDNNSTLKGLGTNVSTYSCDCKGKLAIEESRTTSKSEILGLQHRLVEVEKRLMSTDSKAENVKVDCLKKNEEKEKLQKLYSDLEDKTLEVKNLRSDFDELIEMNRKKVQEIDEYKNRVKDMEKCEKESVERFRVMSRKGKSLAKSVSMLKKENSELRDQVGELQKLKRLCEEETAEILKSRKQSDEEVRSILREIQFLSVGESPTSNNLDGIRIIGNIRRSFEAKDLYISELMCSLEMLERENASLLNAQRSFGEGIRMGFDEKLHKGFKLSTVKSSPKETEKSKTRKTDIGFKGTMEKDKVWVDDVKMNVRDLIDVEDLLDDAQDSLPFSEEGKESKEGIRHSYAIRDAKNTAVFRTTDPKQSKRRLQDSYGLSKDNKTLSSGYEHDVASTCKLRKEGKRKSKHTKRETKKHCNTFMAECFKTTPDNNEEKSNIEILCQENSFEDMELIDSDIDDLLDELLLQN